jgi:hypothetical protein
MNNQEANGAEMIPQTSTESCQERKQNERQLVESLFREALERQERGRALSHQQASHAAQPRTISYTELPAPQRHSQLVREWNFYRREVGKLLAEGHEGQFILIKGEEIIGIWDTQEEAETVARLRYLLQPCLIHQVRSREPLLRTSSRFWR